MNSFLFNATLMNILTTQIVQFTCDILNRYAMDSYFYQQLVINKYTNFFYYFTQYNIFYYALCAVSLFTLIFFIVRGGHRIKFSEIEKEMNKKNKKGKGSKDKRKGSGKDMEKGGKKQQLLSN